MKEKLNMLVRKDFPIDNRFNLKANYIDGLQSRNVANAELYKQIHDERPYTTTNSEKFESMHNAGQVQGIPVVVYINNDFYGLFTMTTVKPDEKVFDNKNGIAIQGNVASDGTKFKTNTPVVSFNPEPTDDFEILYAYTDDVSIVSKTVSELATFINSSSDEDFKTKIKEHIDLLSVIDWLLLVSVTNQTDMSSKNIIHVTYDNKKWYSLPYDHDNSFGVIFNGSKINDLTFNFLDSNTGWNRLHSRVAKLFKNEIIERYNELISKNIITTQNIQKIYNDYILKIGTEDWEKEKARWKGNPSFDLIDYDHLMRIIKDRQKLVKKQISEM